MQLPPPCLSVCINNPDLPSHIKNPSPLNNCVYVNTTLFITQRYQSGKIGGSEPVQSFFNAPKTLLHCHARSCTSWAGNVSGRSLTSYQTNQPIARTHNVQSREAWSTALVLSFLVSSTSQSFIKQ
ncbi:hypothetical protein PGTUg99_014010 [Puccinia graminis f. sp. tritici]|uniref:Uncharacterized protein n=1 Tax=Puccinia graminis f. sp. tritici TaxID=56615 RepID=A0A5B0S675_PUCGR|nr:hypothetical protein PGTUg99_014010 [Puccinia graminis f. sp. tritici]